MGTRVLRVEDPEFLTTGATYTADLKDPRLNGSVFVAFVRATMAFAKITSAIDTSEAKKLDGVLGVFTAEDFADLPPAPAPVPLFPAPMMNRPLLAKDDVKFMGEPVAVVVAETAAIAADAAELVFVDYEQRDAVIDLKESAEGKNIIYADYEIEVDPESGATAPLDTNIALDFTLMGMATGINEDIFKDCEVTVNTELVNHKVAPAPLEGRSVACVWEAENLIYWSSNQTAHGVHGPLTQVYGLDPSAIRVITPDVGGGFGQKISPTPEELLMPAISKKVNRPVRWTETRSENMLAAGHGRGQTQELTIGGTKDGKVQAYQLEVIGDAGAYTAMNAFLPYFTHTMASGSYAIEKIQTNVKSVMTNTTPTVAYRGAGRPEAALAIERAMDLFAQKIGMDPAEVRRKNLIPADQFPYTTSVGTEYDSGNYEQALDSALKAADYKKLRKEQEDRRKSGDTKLLGIGLACYVEVTAGPAPGGNEFAKVEITEDGKAKVYSGALSHGQSHKTSFAMLAADQLGMDINDIEVIQGDTELVAQGTGTFGSRSLQLGGSAVHEASGKIAETAKELASSLLEAKVDDIVIEEGKFFVAGTPAVSVSWTEVVKSSKELLTEDSDFNANCSYSYGSHVAVVEVDSETGRVELLRLISCDDSGIILNPMIVEGQRHGGNAQGIAQALLEEVYYDENGNMLTSNFADYQIISAAELPSFELETTEVASPNNPLGAKGIGESGTIGSTPAVQNAVVDALSHLGVDHIDIPCTPERVWRTITAARDGK